MHFALLYFFAVVDTIILVLAFIVFAALFINMFTKLFYIIRILKHFSIITCISFLRIIVRIFYYFMFGYFFFLVFALFSCLCIVPVFALFLSLHCSCLCIVLVFALFLCLFVNVLHGFYLFTYFNDYKVPPFPYSYTLSQCPCGDCLTHRGKFHILKNLPG